MKYWEKIADNLSKASWSWGCVSAIDLNGRTIWIADAHRERKAVHCQSRRKADRVVELERQVFTVTFYHESIHDDSSVETNDGN